MPAVRYRIHLDGTPASREQLDRVEEIEVDQEIDAAWEARLRIPICADESGRWDGEDEPYLQPGTRVRVEVKVGERAWEPLIDGPVVGSDRRTSSEPGQSSLVVIVHDDSAYLNRDDEIRSFENLRDDEIASRLFDATSQIARKDVERAQPCTCSTAAHEMQRGSRMALLRRLARRQGMHAYVLPGREPGQSVGCFRKLPSAVDGLPDMVLLGAERNIRTFNVASDSQSPAEVRSYSLSLGDRSVAQGTSRTRDLELLGSEAALSATGQPAQRLARADADCCLEPERAAQVEAERAAFALEATGSVIWDCYGAALSPYRAVRVRAVGSRLSGTYVLKKVSHRLDRWRYTQDFTVMRNATSGGAGAGLPDLAAGIF